MDELIAFLSKIAKVPDHMRVYLAEIMELQHFDRNQFLFKGGNVNEQVYFIIEGLVRCYKIYEDASDGRIYELNKWFKYDGMLIISTESYVQQTPSDEYIQALKPTEVLMTTFSQLAIIYERWPVFYQHSHYVATQHAIFEDHVADMRQLPTAPARYLYLQKNFSDLEYRVPQKYLASFMGMEATTLSKIKATINGKKSVAKMLKSHKKGRKNTGNI